MTSTGSETGAAPTRPNPSPAHGEPTLTPAVAPAELIAAQQMSNVGLLAAGLAHDLNNLLTVILGSAELARDIVPPPSPARNHLATIESAVRRAGEMCRAMLACARTDTHLPEKIDANTLVRDTVKLLQTSTLAFHRVRFDLGLNLPPLHANVAQFRQILLNLLTNAAEACGRRGGRIRITTSTTHLEPRTVRHLRPAGVQPGQYFRLRVADDGCGMDEATQERLFTPFFSRKAQGRGLGLASLLEIARAHGGGVRVFSESGRGSIFDVYLPLPAPSQAPAAAPPGAASGGASRPNRPRLSASVLIADDEEILRNSLANYLTTQGLAVQTVGNGEAALTYLAAHPETDLLLIDLMMPSLSGVDVVAALRAAGSRIPAVLMTGNADPEIVHQLDQSAPTAVLTKPFSLTDLLRVITEMVPARK